jgi:hypothetical protein
MAARDECKRTYHRMTAVNITKYSNILTLLHKRHMRDLTDIIENGFRTTVKKTYISYQNKLIVDKTKSCKFYCAYLSDI